MTATGSKRAEIESEGRIEGWKEGRGVGWGEKRRDESNFEEEETK
jgi:hypothetical protein